MHSPAPSFTIEQILFLLQRLDILNFPEQSCSYTTQCLRSGRLLNDNLSAIRDAIGDATARVLIGFHALSGAYINWFVVRKWQDITLGDSAMQGSSNAREAFQEAFCLRNPVHLEISVTDALEEYVCKWYQPDTHVVRLTE